jgi:hypothetical protein
MITRASIELALVDVALDPNPKRAVRGIQPRFSIRARSDVEAIWDAVFVTFLSAYRGYGDTKKARKMRPKRPTALAIPNGKDLCTT